MEIDINLNDLIMSDEQVETFAYNIYQDIKEYINNNTKEYIKYFVKEVIKQASRYAVIRLEKYEKSKYKIKQYC